MKLKETIVRRFSAPSHMNPQFMSDEYMNRRRSFGRGGAGNTRSREEATLPGPPLSGIPKPNTNSHNTDLDHHQYQGQEGDREREWERQQRRRRSSVWSSMSISSSSSSTGSGTHDSESAALSSSGSWLSGMRQVFQSGGSGGHGHGYGHGRGQSPPLALGPSGRRRKGRSLVSLGKERAS